MFTYWYIVHVDYRYTMAVYLKWSHPHYKVFTVDLGNKEPTLWLYNTVILPTTLLYLPGPMALTLTIPLLIIVVSRVNLRILLTRRCMVLGKSPCIVLYVLGIRVQIFLIHEKWMTIIYITLKKIDCHKNMNPQNVASQATKI